MPLISVIIPAYNQGQFVAAAVQSVLDQNLSDLEVLVVDDGSTDNTYHVVARFSDPRIKYFYQENRGLSAARNFGLRHATADYLTFLDSDDLFLPCKLELLVQRMEAEPDCGLVAGQAIPFDESGQHPEKIYATPLPLDSTELLLGNPLHVGSVLLRRSWQERVGFFDEELRSYEDWDMWLRLARIGCPMSWVAQPVSLYRFHRQQMTGNSVQMSQSTFAVLYKIFSDPFVPHRWQAMCNQAYAYAFLRTAAQAFHTRDFEHGKNCLLEAARLYPELLGDNSAPLVNRFCAWADSPKIADPLQFLKDIYTHLPDDFTDLRSRRRTLLGQAAMQHTIESYSRGDFATTRMAALNTFWFDPKRLLNRGAVSICLRAWLQPITSRWT